LPDETYKKGCQIYFDNGRKMIDSDGDELNDTRELWFATDPFKAEQKDTELTKTIGAQDYIIKGESNNPKNKDSDKDGLNDYEEIYVYKTNINSVDSDKDGFTDGEEVKYGYNPNGTGKLKK